MGWWTGKIRQTWRHVAGRVSSTECRAVAKMLSPAQHALFEAMHPADQRHGLDVVASLRRAGHDEPDLLLAGLFHDAAKGRGVRLWHRIAWSLGERYGEGFLRLGARLPGGDEAFESIRHHPTRSAELALAAGCTTLTADLIRNQSTPRDPALGAALLRADQAN